MPTGLGAVERDATQTRPRGVRLLVAEPELAEGLPPSTAEAATRALAVPIIEVGEGDERLLERDPDPSSGLLGLLVLEGLLLREVEIPGTAHADLIGDGDLVLPGGLETASGTCTVGWRVLEPTRLAVLDRHFLTRVQEWPQVLARLTERALRRNLELGCLSAIRNQTRVDDRIHRLLWHYADRWGRVTRDGVSIQLPLTHEYVGKLVGAHRPSVTSAIGMLERRGLLHRPSPGTWLLTRAQTAQPTPLRRSA
jgi:CRP/FNR family transcriptional regulator, cyclic AMP receptor protein